MKMKNLQAKIGYTFKNVSLLETALTHSSYANESKKESNERLEFLGDSVLSIIISDYIFRRLSKVDEGWLSKYRATLVCEQSLNEVAKKINLSNYIRLGKGEEMTGGRERASIVSDAFEAVLAAIYLDGGMETARKWVINLMRDSIEEVVSGHGYADYKTMLQETLQKGTTGKVTYRTVSEAGQDHNKIFEVEVLVDGEAKGKGEGHNKKEAEQNAAHSVLQDMGKVQ
jgi:ribonuclease-3